MLFFGLRQHGPGLIELGGTIVGLDLAKNLAFFDVIALFEMQRLDRAFHFGFDIDRV
jgi:hypothetical protein